MLEKANYSCFITDIHNITSNLGIIDLIEMIIAKKYSKVQADTDRRKSVTRANRLFKYF